MRFLILLIFAAISLAPASNAGTLTTREGKTLTGNLTLQDDHITITPGNQSIPLKDIKHATFAPAAGPPAPIYGKPRRDRAKVETANLFVEYFADPEMKDRRLARYESQILSSWDTRTPPDPAIPARVYIRYSGYLLPKYSEDYTFTTDVEGPVKLWIDGKLIIDRAPDKKTRNQAKAVIPLKANTPTPFKMEIIPGRYSVYSRISWSSHKTNNTWIPASAFVLTPESIKVPELSIVTPEDSSDFRNPQSIPFDIHVDHPGAKIASLDLLDGPAVVASTKTSPYHFDWKSPPQGQHKIKVRAIDEKGISSVSQPIELFIGDAGEQDSLPAPWARQTLSKKGDRLPGQISFKNGVFKITKAGGQITEDDDSPEFIYQPINGDFEIIAHLAGLTQNDNRVGPLAGLMIREQMTGQDRFVAIVVGPGATVIARRQDSWAHTTTTERAESAATWLKLARHGNRIRAYTSTDGKSWSLLGTNHIDLPERLFVGLCNMTRDKETPAVATFDNVSVTPGPPAMAYPAAGILFHSGSFLACQALGFGKTGALAYDRNGQRHYAQSPDVARLIYKPIMSELAQTLAPGHSGALLGSGDFIEGDLKEITWRVTVSNIVFGRRTMDIKGSDILAVCMKDADVPSLPFVITATDGSIYQCKSIKTDQENITIEDPSLGAVELPLKELAQIKVN
jgi:regulation of enolase protein 1 (concanavalin A-like superfamily)